MIILGIDPGTATTGWGVIRSETKSITCIDVGTIATAAGLPLPIRLETIYTDLIELLTTFVPDSVAVEELFFNTNAKTALSVGHARGVVLLAAQQKHIPVFMYTPLQVKMSVTGYGRADKKQMQSMVQTLLKLKTIPTPDDAADALAIAMTHAFSQKVNSLKKGEK